MGDNVPRMAIRLDWIWLSSPRLRMQVGWADGLGSAAFDLVWDEFLFIPEKMQL